MARKTKEAALATREALIDAAERVFRREGVTGTSLAEVAAAAGVTRGAIYWHFRDKVELFEAMCERTMLPLDAALVHAAETDHDDPLGALQALAVDALTRLARDARAQAVFEIMLHKCEHVGELSDRSGGQAGERRACLAHVEQVFAQAVRAGQLPPDTDTTLASHMMHAYVVGLMHQWVRDPQDFDLAQSAPAIVDAFIAGLRSTPPRRKVAPGSAEHASAAAAD